MNTPMQDACDSTVAALKAGAHKLAIMYQFRRPEWVDTDGTVHEAHLLTEDQIFARLKLLVIAALADGCVRWSEPIVAIHRDQEVSYANMKRLSRTERMESERRM